MDLELKVQGFRAHGLEEIVWVSGNVIFRFLIIHRDPCSECTFGLFPICGKFRIPVDEPALKANPIKLSLERAIDAHAAELHQVRGHARYWQRHETATDVHFEPPAGVNKPLHSNLTQPVQP